MTTPTSTVVSPEPDRLYDLLPTLYRIADQQQVQPPLQALLELISAEADDLRDNIQQLWNDFFIETCQSWVIPYIGDLVGNVPLYSLDPSAAAETAQSLLLDDLTGPDLSAPGAIPTRADVAKTIYYRRRKGTPAMLEELARDVTGWGAHVVEFFQHLRWNQHLEHLRFDAPGHPDLRSIDVCDRIGGAWDSTASYTVDVRAINEWDGWYNVPNLGFFLWRLGAYPLSHVTPRAIGGSTWRLTFSPLGLDTALFSPGTQPPGASGLASELTVPLPIRAAAFFEDLRSAPAPNPDLTTAYYGNLDVAALAVYRKTSGGYKQLNEIRCANLESWDAIAQPTDGIVAIDPTRGRLIVPDSLNGETIVVSYNYGFSAPMGGGEYARQKWLALLTEGVKTTVGAGDDLDSLIHNRDAQHSLFEIGDSATYELSSQITIGAGESLVIQAADGCRPHIRVNRGSGRLEIDSPGPGASLTLGGVLFEGALDVTGDLDKLRVLHSTLVPGRRVAQESGPGGDGPSLVVHDEAGTTPVNTKLDVEIVFSIVGALRIPQTIDKLYLLDSIVDGITRKGAELGPHSYAVCDASRKSGPPAHIERSTLLGRSRFQKLEFASESIFTDRVVAVEQDGCVRFSYVTQTSTTPQRYRCQPALEIEREIAAAQAGLPLSPIAQHDIAEMVVGWLVPSFESVRYGDPGFCQLRLSCPVQIRTGAQDGAEMGAFCLLMQPQREANLRLRLDEYLPVGLEAGLIYAT